MRIGIHQPNFCPRESFFDKMRSVDLFVLLNHCKYEAHNYQNRFRADDQWFTMSVKRKTQLIVEKEYLNPKVDWEIIKRTWPGLAVFDSFIYKSLWKTNGSIIRHASTLLGITTPIVDDYETHLRSTDRLIDICKHWGADTYLSGDSGRHYMNMELFEQAGIKVEFQETSGKLYKPLVEMI